MRIEEGRTWIASSPSTTMTAPPSAVSAAARPHVSVSPLEPTDSDLLAVSEISYQAFQFVSRP